MQDKFMLFDVEFVRTHANAKLPVRSTIGAAGFDVFAVEDTVLGPGERVLISTGWKIGLPQGWECQVRPRSGLAFKNGITVLNTPGTIDDDYRGDLKIMLINHSFAEYYVQAGERVAQLVFAPVFGNLVQMQEVSKFSETTVRGENGFGSTGR